MKQLKELVIKAMLEKGWRLYYLDRREDAIKAWDELIQKFSSETDEEIQNTVEKARENLKKNS